MAATPKGLEESPVAPNNALNRNVAAPALQTEQYDAGVRWAAFANMKLIAGVFNVEKPYFDLDAAGFFTELGTVEHRGVELSLAGNPLDESHRRSPARAFWTPRSRARRSMPGSIGEKPVGTARQYSLATADFRLGGTGVSLDATVEHISSQVANSDKHDRGAGPRSAAPGRPLSLQALRASPPRCGCMVQNVFDKYGWTAVEQRRVRVQLAAPLHRVHHRGSVAA